MSSEAAITVQAVEAAVLDVLSIPDRAGSIDPNTPLASALPELDSLSILELIVDLEQRFGIQVSDEDVTADTFESLASLTAFVQSKR